MTKDSIQEFLNYKLVELEQYTISVHDIVKVIFIIILTKVIILAIKKTLLKMNKIKEESDIRRLINTKLAENNITIPFPQMDVHLKNEIS
jgi:small-conductance mechanosensitive channel